VDGLAFLALVREGEFVYVAEFKFLHFAVAFLKVVVV
jgi:hypothetical protein